MEGSSSTSQGLASLTSKDDRLTSMSTANAELNETFPDFKKGNFPRQIVDTAPWEANYYAGPQIAPQRTISRILSVDCCGDFQNTNKALGQ